jgi:hypothetical protein
MSIEEERQRGREGARKKARRGLKSDFKYYEYVQRTNKAARAQEGCTHESPRSAILEYCRCVNLMNINKGTKPDLKGLRSARRK